MFSNLTRLYDKGTISAGAFLERMLYELTGQGRLILLLVKCKLSCIRRFMGY